MPIGAGDERHYLLHGLAEARQIFQPQTAPAPRPQNLADGFGAEARHAQQALAVGGVDVDGIPFAVLQRPSGFRIDMQVEHPARVDADNLLDAETVEAQQPVGLIQSVFAHQGRLDQR
jgi:hypothetical protein